MKYVLCLLAVMCAGTAWADAAVDSMDHGCFDVKTFKDVPCPPELSRNPFNGKMEPKREYFADRHSIIGGVVVEWSRIEQGLGEDGKVYWRKRP